MRFMMLVKHAQELSGAPPQALMNAMEKLTVEANQAGTMVTAGGLAPVTASTSPGLWSANEIPGSVSTICWTSMIGRPAGFGIDVVVGEASAPFTGLLANALCAIAAAMVGGMRCSTESFAIEITIGFF